MFINHSGDLIQQWTDSLAQYKTFLDKSEDLSPATRRGYLGDVRQFIKWCEQNEMMGDSTMFQPALVATSTITKYRDSLQHTSNLKPASVKRY